MTRARSGTLDPAIYQELQKLVLEHNDDVSISEC